jgi:hypothetical protein
LVIYRLGNLPIEKGGEAIASGLPITGVQPAASARLPTPHNRMQKVGYGKIA